MYIHVRTIAHTHIHPIVSIHHLEFVKLALPDDGIVFFNDSCFVFCRANDIGLPISPTHPIRALISCCSEHYP